MDLLGGMDRVIMALRSTKIPHLLPCERRIDESDRPGHMIQVKAAGTKAQIDNISVKNCPAHCFTLGGTNLVVKNVNIDTSAGNAANSASGGKAAAHKYVFFTLWRGMETNVLVVPMDLMLKLRM